MNTKSNIVTRGSATRENTAAVYAETTTPPWAYSTKMTSYQR